jgi:hypothetical protein
MPVQTLYKYRALTNWAPIIDIIANGRLYAAPFERLNDPMEGRYYYFGDAVSAGFRKAIYQSKVKLNICSLSAARNNTLLWSYYANGHAGVAFAVQVKKRRSSSLEVQPVTYDSWVNIGPQELKQQPDKLALRILTQKQQPWAHEQEVRVFSRDTYVPITLTEILLGCNISDIDRELLTTVARKWHPKIKITKVQRSSLDEPDAVSVRAIET